MSLPVFAPPYPPSSTEDQPEVKILKADFGDGYSQDGADGINNVRSVFRLQWSVLTPDQADEIVAFFKARKGYERFWYTPSDSSVAVKVSCPEWARSRRTPNAVTATVREQFDLAD